MTCREFQESLSAYLDREMSAQDAELMAAHAETCARCQKERSLMLKMKSTLREQRVPGMPPDLLAAIEARTLLKERWWDSAGFRTRWLPALVALSTAVGALWLSKSHSNPRPEALIPIATGPATGPVVSHVLLPHEVEAETETQEKGESRESTKSSPTGDSPSRKS